MNMRNVHGTFITYITQNIGISKFEKHITISQCRYETFYYLWVKGFGIRKRDTHSFYSGFFICPPPSNTCGTRHKGLHEQAKVNRLPLRQVSSQLTDFFKISQNPPRTSGVWRHPHLLAPFLISGYCDISERHVCFARPPVHEHLC